MFSPNFFYLPQKNLFAPHFALLQSKSTSKVTVGDCLNDFNLLDHGFCVLKTSSKSKKNNYVKNQVSFLDKKGSGISFQSIGQEELPGLGKRKILVSAGEPEKLFRKKINGELDKALIKVDDTIINHLESLYGIKYEIKGKTLLQNEGVINYQRVHYDDKPDCNC